MPAVVAALAAPGDLVLTMGAGDITQMGPLVLDEIAASGPPDAADGRQDGSGQTDDRRAPARPGAAPGGATRAPRPARPPAGGPGAGGAAAGRAGRRRPHPWRAAFFALAAVGVVAGVAWALLGNRLFVVRSVSGDRDPPGAARGGHRGRRRPPGHAAVAASTPGR